MVSCVNDCLDVYPNSAMELLVYANFVEELGYKLQDCARQIPDCISDVVRYSILFHDRDVLMKSLKFIRPSKYPSLAIPIDGTKIFYFADLLFTYAVSDQGYFCPLWPNHFNNGLSKIECTPNQTPLLSI